MIEPDADLPGHVGPGQVLPDDLLSVAGLDLDLSADQRATLSREEVGSITAAGVLFEAVLEAGFALQITRSSDLTDPRITFLLHEMGEETRHQRMFIRMLADLFNAPGETTGARCQGSSEAIMLGALSLKWKWKERQ